MLNLDDKPKNAKFSKTWLTHVKPSLIQLT